MDEKIKKLLELKNELIQEIEMLEKHERDCGEDMSNDISYNRGYIGAIDYVYDLFTKEDVKNG